MSKFNSTLTAERVREVLDYDPETGVFTRRGDTFKTVEHKHGLGYRTMRIDGSVLLSHRVAWLWVHGRWPVGEIDHINGVRDDNRLTNLRDVSRGYNMQNLKSAQSNNKHSGLLGVYRNRSKWIARIMVDGVYYHLGTFEIPEEAHQCYLGAKRLLHPGNTL